MLRNVKVYRPDGREVLIRLFVKAGAYTVTRGRTTVLQITSEEEARKKLDAVVAEMPKVSRPPRKKKLVVFRGGLPS